MRGSEMPEQINARPEGQLAMGEGRVKQVSRGGVRSSVWDRLRLKCTGDI